MSQQHHHHASIRNTAGMPRSGMVIRHGSAKADEVERTVIQNLRYIFTRPQAEQRETLILSCRSINLDLRSFPQDQMNLIHNNWIRRCRLFLSTPKEDRLLYLHHLQMKFQGRPDADARFQMATKIFPSYENFVRSIRVGMYKESLDGNWFSWWNKALTAMVSSNNVTRPDLLRWDQDLIRHLMEYEIIRNLDSNVGSNQLPPISSAREGTQGTLPPVSQVMRGSTSYGSSYQNYGSSSYSNAGSSHQQSSSRSHSSRHGRRN